MSHVIHREEYFDYEVKTKTQRGKIFAEFNAMAKHEGYMEGSRGLYSPIQWRDDLEPFMTREDAYNYVDNFDRHNYAQIAVRFYENAKPSKKLEKMKIDLSKFQAQYNDEFREEYYIKHPIKSKFFSCKHCETKIAWQFYTNASYKNKNLCPVCGQDLRPKTELMKLERLKKKIHDLEEKITVLEKKENMSPKGRKLMWLVKIEYHV